MTALYAVAGNPVFHSRSPIIFNTAFRELAVDARYLRLAASTAREIIDLARQIGLDGLNITSPFKTGIMGHLDGLEADAARVGSVNTVVKRAGRYIGCNTDIAGVLSAVRGAGLEPSGQKAIVLGAGGAARAAAFALLSAGGSVVLSNRTFERARDAAKALGCEAVPLHDVAGPLAEARLLISAIASADRVVDPALLHPDLLVLDALYSRPTALVRDAGDRGCAVIDGREWLLGQAAPAFSLFTALSAPLGPMRKALFKTRRDARRNIALIGFMGTGKSAVASGIAGMSGLTLLDIDRQIEKKAGSAIAEIFERSGEEAFRRMEQAEIDGLRLVTRHVVSLGGGAVGTRANVRVLRNNCLSVWLWADVPTILQRVGKDGTRPLLSGNDAEADARALLAMRLSGYARAADLLISTEGKGPEEIAGRIWDEIHHAFTG
ncbi:MAG: shikimate kinase [Syntrophorhabdales bacterium]|jgi:shikimate dehydrogenase